MTQHWCLTHNMTHNSYVQQKKHDTYHDTTLMFNKEHDTQHLLSTQNMNHMTEH